MSSDEFLYQIRKGEKVKFVYVNMKDPMTKYMKSVNEIFEKTTQIICRWNLKIKK